MGIDVAKGHDKAVVTYPIAEIFSSPQGEGVYSGQFQTFIRLAGCTVGKPYPKKKAVESFVVNVCARMGNTHWCPRECTPVVELPIYTEKCTLYDGREFPCDTDYRVHDRLTAEDITNQIPAGVDDVCITGGEPLMHDLRPLITYLFGIGRRIHIETSGTIDKALHPDIWVTCSPKKGVLTSMLVRANEVKILVDEDFDPERNVGINYLVSLSYKKPVFLHPVNPEKEVSAKNLQLCLDWQIKFPGFRVGPQMHKAMSSILNKEIR